MLKQLFNEVLSLSRT